MSTFPQIIPLYFDRASRRRRDALAEIGRRASHLERFAPAWQMLDRRGLNVRDTTWDSGFLQIEGFAERPTVEWRWRCFADTLVFSDRDGSEVACIGFDGDAADLAWLERAVVTARYGEPAANADLAAPCEPLSAATA